MSVEMILKDNMPHESANESVSQSGNINVICHTSDLVENSGVCALVNDEQVALFYLPNSVKKLFAVSNWDPFGKANVLSRGILGDVKGAVVVASPLYKQHFDLETGVCVEDSSVQLKTFAVKIEGDQVLLG